MPNTYPYNNKPGFSQGREIYERVFRLSKHNQVYTAVNDARRAHILFVEEMEEFITAWLHGYNYVEPAVPGTIELDAPRCAWCGTSADEVPIGVTEDTRELICEYCAERNGQ